MTLYAKVRDDVSHRGERIYDHRSGRYYGSDEVGTAVAHSNDREGRVNVVTASGSFATFDSIDLDYEEVGE